MGTTWPAGFSDSASIDVVSASADIVWSTLADIEKYPHVFSAVESVTVPDERHRTTTTTTTSNRSVLAAVDRSLSSTTTDNGTLATTAGVTSVNEFYNGMSWSETRNYSGRTATVQKFVTSVCIETTTGDKSEEISSTEVSNTVTAMNNHTVSKNITIRRCVRMNVTVPSHSKFSGVVNTCTWIVESTVDNNNNNTCRLYSSTAILPKRSFMLFTIFCCLLKGHNINVVNEKVKGMLSREVNEIAIEAERRQQQLLENQQQQS